MRSIIRFTHGIKCKKMEPKEELLIAKKEVAKFNKQITGIECKIAALKKELIAKFCPHKIGDKAIVTGNSVRYKKELYCKAITFLYYTFPMKFIYEFSETNDDGKYNPIVYIYNAKIEWL